MDDEHAILSEYANCAVIVSHPDEETLWAGGVLLMHPESCWNVVTLSGAGNTALSERFSAAMGHFGAVGNMGDLIDPETATAPRAAAVEGTILSLLASDRYDLVITHCLWGEHTHRPGHEEIAKGIIALRASERLKVDRVWMFAYDDAGGRRLPQAAAGADVTVELSTDIWQRKRAILTDVYGHTEDSFEAQAAPSQEAFWILAKGS